MTLPDTQAERRTLAGDNIHETQRRVPRIVPDSNGNNNEYAGINEVEKATQDEPGIITTSRGAKVRVRAIANMMLAEARRKIKPPKVPTYYDKDKETHEENPLHPDYVAEMQEHNIRVGTMGATAMLAFGTEVLFLPVDVQTCESSGWADDLKTILDVDVPADGKGRYAAWLRLYMLTDPDLTAVLDGVRRASGIVTEEEAREAEDAFRGDKEPDTAEGVRADTEG